MLAAKEVTAVTHHGLIREGICFFGFGIQLLRYGGSDGTRTRGL